MGKYIYLYKFSMYKKKTQMGASNNPCKFYACLSKVLMTALALSQG